MVCFCSIILLITSIYSYFISLNMRKGISQLFIQKEFNIWSDLSYFLWVFQLIIKVFQHIFQCKILRLFFTQYFSPFYPFGGSASFATVVVFGITGSFFVLCIIPVVPAFRSASYLTRNSSIFLSKSDISLYTPSLLC